jgi:UDP-glucose 4-epimerase
MPEFPFIIINPTAVYGPRDKDFFVLLQSINNHLELYIGNDQQQLSFVHVSDLVDAIFIAMESKANQQNILVSDLGVYTSKQVNQLIKQQLNKKTIPIIISPSVAHVLAIILEKLGKIRGKIPVLNRERLKEFKAPNWSVDCTELAALGFQPKFDLENGLKNAIGWYREHGWMK